MTDEQPLFKDMDMTPTPKTKPPKKYRCPKCNAPAGLTWDSVQCVWMCWACGVIDKNREAPDGYR